MIKPNTIEDLLIRFDELNFVPTNLIPFDPDEYAKAWKKSLIKAIEDERKEMARDILDMLDQPCDECEEVEDGYSHSACLCARMIIAEKIVKYYGLEEYE